MGSPVLGIDLGTTNSAVAVALDGAVRVLGDTEGNKLFPSVVSFHPRGEVLVGYPARERRLVDAQNTIYSVKRLIGRPFRSEEVQRAVDRLPFAFQEGPTGGALVVARGETYTLPEVSAFVLRGVRAQAEEALGQACRRAVVTVPANFNELQRSATKAAGRVAGLEVLRILNEPTAAALAYGCGRAGNKERVAIYDLGGGTFDVTILELAGSVFEVMATAGDTFLGGDDVDVAVAQRMVEAFLAQHRYDVRSDVQAYERIRAAAEWAKCQLSTSEDVDLTIEELSYGDAGAPMDLQFKLGRAELDLVARPFVARTFDVCEEAMRLAGVRPTQLDQVILVGGSTRMPLVRAMVAEYFGREPLASIDPDLVVAQGAAIQGASLAGQAEGPSTGTTAIGRIALKRMGAPPVEAREAAPGGPAFQPKRPAAPPPAPPVLAEALQPSSQIEGEIEELGEDLIALELDESALPANRLPASPPERSPAPPVPPVRSPAGSSLERSRVPAPEEIQLPLDGAPLLLDVTPQSLRIETAGGFTEAVIERNAAIPVEQSRRFSTSQDFQSAVRARVCQGEARRLSENQELGVVELTGIAPAPRGQTQIEVTFMLDADGTLQVRARDERTGAEQRIRISLVGGVQDGEIQRMQERQQALLG